MISTARPLVMGFAVLALLGAMVFAALPRSGFRQTQMLGQHSQAIAINSPEFGRRRIVDSRLAPYATVGKFVGTVACTAAVVLDPRIIVTAGHCITERDGSIRRSALSFRLGYQTGKDLGQFEASVWAVGSKQSFRRQSVHAASQDWAILVLDRAPDAVQPFLLSHQSIPDLISSRQQLLMPAYSDDIGAADVLSVDPACSVQDLVWDVLVHDCAARYGSSGAPLLIRDGPRYAVVGVHTGAMFASDGPWEQNSDRSCSDGEAIYAVPSWPTTSLGRGAFTGFVRAANAWANQRPASVLADFGPSRIKTFATANGQ